MIILAAVDRSTRADTVLEEAIGLAETFGDTVHAVHVMSNSEFVGLEVTRARDSGQAVTMDQIRDKAKSVAETKAAEFEYPMESVGLVGDEADELIEYSEELDARYIVVGPRKRSPTGKVLFGSVAQTVILNSRIPVISVSAVSSATERE